jgi:cysteine desulfurase
MTPYFTEIFGNPSSSHYFGQQAEGALEECRSKLASMLGAQPDEILFTASGSEGDNLALRGAAFAQRSATGKDTILVSPVEHSAVANTVRQLRERYGFTIKKLRVDNYGKIDLNDLQTKIDEKTAIVSVIYANNEIGTINPVGQIGKICAERGVIFHTDAVQACAHLAIDVSSDQIGLLNIAAHKFYGPKGVGALVKRKALTILPQTTGGKQENKLRAGTHNVPGIIGLTKALELALQNREAENKRLVRLRDRIIRFVEYEIPGSHLTGHPQDRLPNHASFVFDAINGNDLVIMLDMAGFACSSGSACKVGDPKPSEVLLALGLTPDQAMGSLRVTLGKYSIDEHIDRFLDFLPEAVKKLRK